MRVQNLTSPRSGGKVANQFKIEGDGGEYFQSYDSIIAFISQDPDDNVLVVGEDYNYSNTTSKYFSQWLRDWGFYDDDIKTLKKELGKLDIGGQFKIKIAYTEYTVFLTGSVNNWVAYH